MNKLLLSVFLLLPLLIGCNERKNIFITNSSNSVVEQAAEQEEPVPATLFLPPEGSRIRLVIDSNGEQKEFIGLIQVKADDFLTLLVEVPEGESPYTLQIFYIEIVDFEVLELPKDDDQDDPDQGDDNGDDDQDDDDDDDYSDDEKDDAKKNCNYRWNKIHLKWFILSRRLCGKNGVKAIKIVLNRKKLKVIIVCRNRHR